MKRYIFLLYILCVCSVLFASSVEDRYVMKTFENGQLYFILPFDIPSQDTKVKALSADITYLTTADSVTVNMSVCYPSALTADSIVFSGDTHFASTDFQTFFIEMEGKQWLHRYSVRMPWGVLNQLYFQNPPFVLSVYAKERQLVYAFPDKKWEKEKKSIQQILQMITANKRLYK